VDVDNIPLSAVPDEPQSQASAPLASIPLASIPLASIPLASIPLASIGWTAAALDAQGGVALSSIPLNAARHPGGWEAQLAGTALATSLLNATTLADVLRSAPEALDPPAASGKQPVLLSDLTVASSPLASIPLASIALGPVLLSDVPIAGRTGADGLSDWCTALAAAGFACPSPAALATETLGTIGLKGAPLASIPLASIPLASIPLASIPLASIPLASIVVAGSPLASIPLASITITGSPLASIPLASIPLASIGNIVDCSTYDCATKTLGDAFADGRILPAATLGDLASVLGSITLGALAPFLPDDFTLGELLAFLAGPPAVRGYARLPFVDMPTQDFATDPSSVDYTLSFRIDGGPPETGATATVTLPPGFRYARGTAMLTVGTTTSKVGDPLVSGQDLTFFLDGLTSGQPYKLSFKAHPSLILGPSGAASATVVPGIQGPAGLRAARASARTTAATTAALAATAESESVDVEDTWEPNGEVAQPVQPDTVYLSYITSTNDLDAYSLPAPPAGSRVTVTMVPPTGADYDLAAFRPGRQQLRSSPLASIPLDGEPVVDNGVRVTHASESLEPETLADVPLASIPLASISADRGSAEETATFKVRAEDVGQSFRIQVSGYQGSKSDRPYTLLVSVQAAPTIDCGPSPIDTTGQSSLRALPAPASTPAGLNTVFVLDGKRLASGYGAGPAASVATATDALAARADLGVVGTTLDVSSDPAVSTAETSWDEKPCLPERANAVARKVSDVIERYRAARPSLKYVVLVGGDEQIPFFRVDDLATVSNESDYASTFLDKGAQYFGALLSSTVLSDNPYGTPDPTPFLDRELFVPSLAVGRLVETPSEILDAIAQFTSPTVNGSLDPQTALVTGYDFLTDGSQDVAATQTAQHGAANVNSIVNESWTSTQLGTALGASPPSVLSVNAHYDHHRLLPADQNALHTESQLFETSDLAGRDLTRRLWFTMGCHAGFSASDILIGGPSDARALDWAQATAAGGGLLAANTGFGYGDTVAIAYSEKLMSLLAKRLDGTMTAGEALMFAKNDFRGSLGPLDVYDEKVIHEATFYGLPMYRVGPVKPLPPPQAPRPTSVDPKTGLTAASLNAAPSFTRKSGRFGDYFVATDTQVTNYRPVQPSTAFDVTEPGLIARGALITQLASNDVTPFDAAWSTPTTDRTALSPETVYREAFFPTKIPTIQTAYEPVANAPSARRQRLVLVVGQYGKNASGTARQRLFTSVGAQVFYAPEANQNFRHARYGLVQGAQIGGNAAFSVHVAVPGGGQVRRVLVAYHDGGVWKFVDLAQSAGDATLWTGGAPNGTPDAEFFVQAVTSDGTVDVTSFKGRNYQATRPPAPPEGVTVDLAGARGLDGWFTSSVRATVTGAGVRVGVDGDQLAVPSGPLTISGDGIHTITIQTPSGTGSVVVPIDTTAPHVTVATPAAGAVFRVGDVATVSFDCVDAGSGVTSCTGSQANGARLDTAAAGPHTLTVTARDAAGLTTTVTRTYQVVAWPFSGFFFPAKPFPAFAKFVAGLPLPLSFSLDGFRGLKILEGGSIKTQQIKCNAPGPVPGNVNAVVVVPLVYVKLLDTYAIVIRTDRAWRGTCRQVVMTLADGSVHRANFQFVDKDD
jgi:Peptidase family C25